MIKRTLAQLASMCGGELSRPEDDNITVAGVVTDSRKLVPGSLFVPLVGDKYDGHGYAAAALEAGAAATLWQRGRGQAPDGAVILVEDTLAALQALASAYLAETGCRVVGITGSNGKTTTKDMVTALLETRFRVHKTSGNFNNHIGLPLTVLSMPEDTEIAVLEMGMSGRGEIAVLTNIARPDAAVITNVGEAHLLQLGSREEIARAKLEIVLGLRPGGLFVYHGDEPLLAAALQEPEFAAAGDAVPYRFGLSQDNDNYPTGIMNHGQSVTFTTFKYGERAFTLPLPGLHNVVNALAAMAVAGHFGVTPEEMAAGLEKLKLTGMRIEVITAPSGLTVLNDAYNASPLSMKAAIDVLQGMKCSGRRIAVLGDMLELGPDEARFHAEIGEYLDPDRVDRLFTYGPLSRHTAEAAAAVFGTDRVHAFEDKAELIGELAKLAGQRDIVLFKASRGMKLEEAAAALLASAQRS
ncbi:UDP-N-acetylmuramoyl-tripeptide--D-alanyl-D-alanine ligase [Paenibacillus sp. CN-4]|uniref:UDP-N-acetylmuramoyl-tripeptide--D-alanyl-D- alanine ligase n=1 Tax=Paenibacillus nanchangensis TaxID=3348343 RepID=UPI00397B7E89